MENVADGVAALEGDPLFGTEAGESDDDGKRATRRQERLSLASGV